MKSIHLLNRIVTVLLAALLLSFTVPEAVFAQEPECGTESERSVKPAQRSRAEAVFTGLSPMAIPFASDETEQGQAYIAASSGSRTVRVASLRKLLFGRSTELSFSQFFTGNVFCVFGTGSIFDDLFVIHYIHNQDGAKS